MQNHQHPEMEAGVIGCLHRLMTLRIWYTSPKHEGFPKLLVLVSASGPPCRLRYAKLE